MWHLSFPIHSTAEWTVQEKEWTRALAQPARGVLAPLGQRHGFQALSASLQSPRTITPWRQWRLANNGLRGWKDGCRHCQPTQACWKEDTMPGTRQMTSHPTLRTTQVYTPPPFNMWLNSYLEEWRKALAKLDSRSQTFATFPDLVCRQSECLSPRWCLIVDGRCWSLMAHYR